MTTDEAIESFKKLIDIHAANVMSWIKECEKEGDCASVLHKTYISQYNNLVALRARVIPFYLEEAVKSTYPACNRRYFLKGYLGEVEEWGEKQAQPAPGPKEEK